MDSGPQVMAIGAAWIAVCAPIAWFVTKKLGVAAYKKAAKARACTIAEVNPGENVVLTGTVCESDQSPLQVPFGGKPAVWMRVSLGQLTRGKHGEYLDARLAIEDCVPFLLDDNSGRRARILSGRVRCLKADPKGSAVPAHAIQQWLRSRREKGLAAGAANAASVASLEVGAKVSVVATAPASSAPGVAPYRGASATEIVFGSAQPEGPEVVLFDGGVAEAKRLVFAARWTWIILLGLGVILVLIGLLVTVTSGKS